MTIKQKIFTTKTIIILFCAFIIVMSWAYQPDTPYEKCLDSYISANTNIAEYPYKIRPNPLHYAIQECQGVPNE